MSLDEPAISCTRIWSPGTLLIAAVLSFFPFPKEKIESYSSSRIHSPAAGFKKLNRRWILVTAPDNRLLGAKIYRNSLFISWPIITGAQKEIPVVGAPVMKNSPFLSSFLHHWWSVDEESKRWKEIKWEFHEESSRFAIQPQFRIFGGWALFSSGP